MQAGRTHTYTTRLGGGDPDSWGTAGRRGGGRENTAAKNRRPPGGGGAGGGGLGFLVLRASKQGPGGKAVCRWAQRTLQAERRRHGPVDRVRVREKGRCTARGSPFRFVRRVRVPSTLCMYVHRALRYDIYRGEPSRTESNSLTVNLFKQPSFR